MKFNLSIRWKIALLSAAVLCCLMMVLTAVLIAVVQPGFERMEDEIARERMKTVIGMISADKMALELHVSDWAAWDDTYMFASGSDPAFPDRHLPESLFLKHRTHLFAIVLTSGEVQWSYSADQDWLRTDMMPDFLQSQVPDGDPLMFALETNTPMSGLRDGPYGPMLIAAHPITDTLGEADPVGMLVMGRLLSYILADRVEPFIDADVIMGAPDDGLLDPQLDNEQRTESPLVIGRRGDLETLDASVLLSGIDSNEAIVRLSLRMPTSTNFQGTKTILLAIQTTGAGGLAVITVFWLAARGMVLKPLENLQRHIRHVTETGDLDRTPPRMGNDEIGTVARAFNDMQGRVTQLAHYDVLTGLPNKTLFKVLAEQAVARCSRENRRAAVIVLDLDRFKNVNDSLGHGAGDELLRQIGRRLDALVGGGDVVARVGGDEFLLLISGLRDVVEAQDMAARLYTIFDAPYPVRDRSLFVTVSVGISLFPDDDKDLDELIRHADSAMYHAKSLGRNNFQFFDQEMNKRSQELLSMESSLREALVAERLQVFYQPQIDITTQQVIGVETLIRWEHPTKGLIGAGTFLPFAEQSGLHAALDRTVLMAACKQQVAWRAMNLPPFTVAVNICAKNFDTGDLYGMVCKVLEETGADPNYLELEITESHVAREGIDTVRTLEQLREMGIRIVIDDFGTGFASLSYLRKFPVDTIKVDKSFVRELPGNRSDGAIVRAVIALADELDLQVVVEGVERQEQLDWLRTHDCTIIQGYLTGGPLSAVQIVRRINGPVDRELRDLTLQEVGT